MSTLFFTLAALSAVVMFFIALSGCMEMMTPREPAKTKREEAFRVLDVMLLQGAVWSVQSFRQNWRTRHHARRMLYWSFGFLGGSLLFSGLHIWIEISKL